MSDLFNQRPQLLKLVMAVSHDGFVARGPNDDMSWTGHYDKQLFRVLTGVGGTIGVGRVTAESIPKVLQGRTLQVLSGSPRFGMTLGSFAYKYPGAWLGGGQTVALEALRGGYLDEVHLCRAPAELGEGVADRVSPFIAEHVGWSLAMQTELMGVKHEVWRFGSR